MLEAKRISIWRRGYDISADGRPLTRWERSLWRNGGSFALGTQRYEVQGNVWGTRYELSGDRGAPLATAERVGRKNWSVTTSTGAVYQFTRPSVWRPDQVLLGAGGPAGWIRRTSAWSGAASADLPGLPHAVQVFAFVVVLTMWENRSAAAASAAS